MTAFSAILIATIGFPARCVSAAPAASQSDSVVEVRFRNVQSPEANEYVRDKFYDILEPNTFVVRTAWGTGLAGGSFFTIRGISDLKSFIERIDFAKVIEIRGRGVTLEAVVPNPVPRVDRVARALKDLRSGDPRRVDDASRELAKLEPDGRREEVARALEFAVNNNVLARGSLISALGVWGDKQSVPLLIELLKDYVSRRMVMDALAKLKDERGAEAVAALLPDDLPHASKALQAMGSKAELAVIPLLEHPKYEIRIEACKILRVIGTARSVPALRIAGEDPDQRVAQLANTALREIESGTAPAAVPSAPKAAPLRGATAAARPADRPQAPADETSKAPRWEGEIRVPTDDGDVLYPAHSSAFVAVGRNQHASDTREVWNLRTAEKVGAIRGELKLEAPMALSPDGLLLAGRVPGKNQAEVWSVNTSSMVRRLETETTPEFVEFVGPQRLLTVWPHRPVFRIWDLITGEVIREIGVPGSVYRNSITVSPQHSHLAFCVGGENAVRIYELERGTSRKVAVPLVSRFPSVDPQGLVFSCDGSELAGLFEADGKAHVIGWSVDGELTIHHEFRQSLRAQIRISDNYRGRPLEWLPDASGWLVYGHAIVDRSSGALVWSATVEPGASYHARRMLNDNQLLIATGPGPQRVLKAIDLPKAEMVIVKNVVLGGGREGDAKLPPLTEPDWSSFQRIPSQKISAPWSVEPEAIGTQPELPSRPLELKGPASSVQRLLFSRRDLSGLAILHEGKYESGSSIASAAHRRWIDRYDLKTGDSVGRFVFPPGAEFVAMSADGESLLLVDSEDRQRLDVWAVLQGKHVAGWRPYGIEDEGNQQVTWAALVDSNHVLTLNRTGRLVLWELPECRAVYLIEPWKGSAPILSADGKYFADWIEHDIQIRHASTGALHGVITTPVTRGGVKGIIAFHPGGSELASVSNGKLTRWNLKTGEQLAEFAVPFERNPSLYWCEQGLLLGGARSTVRLYDADSGQELWQYLAQSIPLPGGRPDALGVGPDGRHWFESPPSERALATITPVRLPDARVRRAVELLSDNDPTALLRPGQKLDVHFRFAGPLNGAEGFRARLAERFLAKLKTQQITGSIIESGTNPVLPYQRPEQVTGSATGTAFVVGADGYLLTCAHVVEGASKIQVALGGKKYQAQVKSLERVRDLALLKIDAQGLPALPLADSDAVEIGEEVRAVGYPLSSVLGDGVKVTRGTISGINSEGSHKLFQIDASINPGNSGGPLVNERGAIVGVNHAKLSGVTVSSVGFAVPVNFAKRMLNEERVKTAAEPSHDKLDGPTLVKLVSPSVALVTSSFGPTGLVDVSEVVHGPALVVQVIEFVNSNARRPNDPFAAILGSKQSMVPVIELICQVAVVDPDGKPIWSANFRTDIASSAIEVPAGETDIGSYLAAKKWERFASWLAGIDLPFFLTKQPEGVLQLPGSSRVPPSPPSSFPGPFSRTRNSRPDSPPIPAAPAAEPLPVAKERQMLRPEEIDQLLNELKDENKVRAALIRLATAKAPDDRRKEVLAQVEELLTQNTDRVRALAVDVLIEWATKSEISIWVKVLTYGSDAQRQQAMTRLQGVKGEELADAIVKYCILPLGLRFKAMDLLRQMGPVAEKAMMSMLQHPDQGVQGGGADLLKDVGTELCLPALTKLARARDPYHLIRVQAAIKAVCARTGQPEPDL